MHSRSFVEKARSFRELLDSPKLEFIMEAHNGLSGRIAEQAGFKGIWGSGLSMSAALGVRDSNEASWTQILETLEFMADATDIPIMMDGDTGFGNFNNMRRLVTKLCQKGIAAVCIEDKLFPKTNSFIGEGQPLADVGEFCGKIRAGKDSQLDDNFSIVSRIEAFIAGWGLDEALRRAERYHKAGADAILIHSKMHHADEILGFMKEWAGRCPVVIVPTMYYATPTDAFSDADVSMVIWANHALRAAIGAMKSVVQQIHDDQTLLGVEDSLPTVKDVFDLQNNQELVAAEGRYLPSKGRKIAGVVLATSRGTPLGEITEDMPKCMVDVKGQPLLNHLSKLFRDAGVAPITVVRGYRKEAIDLPGFDYVDNDAFADTGEIGSLDLVGNRLEGECLVIYGDVLFRRFILDDLMDSPHDITIVVDGNAKMGEGDVADLVFCDAPYSGADALAGREFAVLSEIGRELAAETAHGEWIGLMRLTARGGEILSKEIAAAHESEEKADLRIPDLLHRIVTKGGKIGVLYISGYWMDVDTIADLARAQSF